MIQKALAKNVMKHGLVDNWATLLSAATHCLWIGSDVCEGRALPSQQRFVYMKINNIEAMRNTKKYHHTFISSETIWLWAIIRIYHTLIWQIDTCEEWRIKLVQTRHCGIALSRVRRELRISFYHSHDVSHEPVKVNFQVKTLQHQRFACCLSVDIQIWKCRAVTWVVIVMPWPLFLMNNDNWHPTRQE